MPVVPRGPDDFLLDAMLAKMEAFRVREAAISAAVDFELDRDRAEPWKDLTKPLVNLEIETDEPKQYDYEATVKAYCFAPEALDKFGKPVGHSRLYYLKEQVRVGLLSLETPDLGLTIGTVKLAKPQWARIHFESREMEDTICAGAWTFRVIYAWEPEDSVTGVLTDIQVSVGPSTALALWAAAYHYGGA